MISSNKAITTTRSVIVAASPNWRTVLIHVLGAGTVYLGGSDVTSSNGLITEKNAVPLQLEVSANETLYAVTGSGSENLRVLEPNG